MQFGKAVLYEGVNGKEKLAFIVGGNEVQADLCVFGDSNPITDIPKRAEGGGHTWREGKL